MPSDSTSRSQSQNTNEGGSYDASDELIENLVQNAKLTINKDPIRQRRAAARMAQRQSCQCNDSLKKYHIMSLFSTSNPTNQYR